MSNDKEAIIQKWIYNTPFIDLKEAVSKCMDEWKSSQLVTNAGGVRLGMRGKVGIIFNWNEPDSRRNVTCELIAVYKDGRIVVQCFDINGDKWESETFSRIEHFIPLEEATTPVANEEQQFNASLIKQLQNERAIDAKRILMFVEALEKIVNCDIGYPYRAATLNQMKLIATEALNNYKK